MIVVLLSTSCGKKGAPLPPLVRIPQAPMEIGAERHGATVDVHFLVPAANIDGSRPANVSRVDVYAITAPPTVTDQQILKAGTRIATVPVKAPRKPDEAIEEDEPAAEMTAPEGRGLDQGAVAHVVEHLTDGAVVPADLTKAAKPQKQKNTKTSGSADATRQPLLMPIFSVPSRSYVGIGITTKGKTGYMSPRATVALVDPPPPPPPPDVKYDEKTVTVSWAPIAGFQSAKLPAGVLPSRTIGFPAPTIAYNVYEVTAATPPVLTRLTKTPIAEAPFSDPRLVWGQERCYAIRAVKVVGDVAVEGDESATHCETFTDTFPPAAPTGLQAVASEGAINLIWDANAEKDVRGYIVLRGVAPAETLEPVTREPIQETSYKDGVKPGVRFVFAVRAVDTAGNLSPLSARVEETAR